jgi:hypothetical protein
MLGDTDYLIFGDSSDVTISWLAAGGLDIVAAGSTELRFGVDATGLDIIFYGDTAGTQLKWDQNGSTNGALLFIDSTATWTLTEGTGALSLTASNVNTSIFTIGSTTANGVDLVWQPATSGNHVKFDAGANTCTFTDLGLLLTGADSSGTLLTIAGIDTTGNSDTVTIAQSGTGSGLKITCSEADSVALTALACANQTTSLVKIDGATANWIGATNVGMLHMTADTAFAHANATMLYVASSATPIASSLGCIARFLDSGADSASSYAVCINSTHNGALNLTGGSDRVALNVAAGTVAFAGAMACTGIATFATGYQATAVSVKPAADSGAGSIIPLGTRMVTVAAVTTNANDWIILPPAATVGQEITILCAAGGNFELRTPVASSDLINNVDCSDGAAEYLCTDTDMIRLVNTAAAKWVATSYTYLGAVRTAVVPDA